MKDIQAVLFDIDGTLIDTKELIFQSFEHTFKVNGVPLMERKDLAKVLGSGAQKTYSEILPTLDSSELYATHAKFQESNINLGVLFEGTHKTLEAIKENGLKIAGITTRGKSAITKSLENANLASFFDLLYSFDDVKNPKPHPEALLNALEKFNIKPHNAVMVGDSKVDIKAGKAAGTHTVGVTTGFHADMIQAENPDYIIHNISDLLPLLNINTK